MDVLVAVMVSLGVAIFAIWMVVKAQAASQAWRGAARSLGFDYVPGGLTKGGSIYGAVRKNAIVVDTIADRGKGVSDRRTRYRLIFEKPLPADFKLVPRGLLSDLGRRLTTSTITFGDRRFDATAVVDGADRQQVLSYLSPERRRRLSDVLAGIGNLKVDQAGIEITTRGVERDAKEVEAVVNKLVLIAGELQREESPAVSPAPAPATTDVAPAPATTDVAPAPATTDVPSVPATTDVAAETVETPSEQEPYEPSDDTATTPPEPSADSSPVTSNKQSSEDPAAPPPKKEAAASVEVGQLCSELFAAKSGGFEASRLFDENYQGRHVRWSGTLVKAERVSFDLVFGFEATGKATFRIHRIMSALSAHHDVYAIVQVPESAIGPLSSHTGEKLAFEGELALCDHVSYSVVLKNGRVLE